MFFVSCSALYVVHSGLRLFKQIVSTNKNIVLLIAENVYGLCVDRARIKSTGSVQPIHFNAVVGHNK